MCEHLNGGRVLYACVNLQVFREDFSSRQPGGLRFTLDESVMLVVVVMSASMAG